MIAQVLTFITERLNQQLNLLGEESTFISLGDLKQNDNKDNQLILSLVNVTEESGAGKISLGRKSGFELANQTVVLDLDVLIAAHFENSKYLEGVSALDTALQAARVFNSLSISQHKELPSGVEKIIFERINVNTDKLMNIWLAAGTSHKPSLLYRLRIMYLTSVD